jgi:signal transduction histidine kinase
MVEHDTLDIRIEKELTEVRPLQADASMLKQVFLNLIKNASEACGQAGELVIRTENDFPWVKITFEDNGPGIQPSLLERIFEPFFTTKESGMGVGLAICRRIVQAHEGRMEVENLLPKGARFLILLP